MRYFFQKKQKKNKLFMNHPFLTGTARHDASADFLWRCSLTDPTTKITRVESVDFSTFVLGYALNYLPENFYFDYSI